MANFGEIQTKFDSDPALCKRFLLDPVGVLAEQGITLAPQQAFQLQQDVMNFTSPAVIAEGKIHIGVRVKVGIITRPPVIPIQVTL